MDRDVVPAGGTERLDVVEADRGGRSRELDGEVAESADGRCEIGLAVVVRGVSCELLVCALGTEVVGMSTGSVVAVVRARDDDGEQFPLLP